MLERIKLLLNITGESKDALLGELIDRAMEFVLNYTNNENCIEYLKGTIISMVIYDYNRIGTEGLASESYSGLNFGYLEGYPSDILGQLKKYRKVKVI
jgi:hypothetical protein